MIEVKIDALDPDVKETVMRWYGEDGVFLIQTEVGGRTAGTLLFSRGAVPDLINGLKQFLGEAPRSAATTET